MNSNLVIFLVIVACVCGLVVGLPSDFRYQESEPATTKESCVLPMVTGICRARMPRWGYDPEKKDCVSFYYGGCFGNANNFLTKDECLNACKDN
ncbi:PI-actitoxin-Axm2a-like [Neodiprion pinetum]|uniref:PI-actitoxin-Axm2a-like n=1 Tax=Neodiprion lecontei TaxID=441921 RepID=A0A6J0BWZ7_NEOLC|nr:PI-actitoxin-Axm2a-like [Neodiprion lecontei]XP_046417103.1 PI-actitoxin-Axm2a-like [Neodiprion fabricii]XP_046473201.1 PI-actitoxin-Axm2a-like [Neodiprion pinetum]